MSELNDINRAGKIKTIFGVAFCFICLAELLFFILLFFLLILTMGLIAIKGIFVHNISYLFFLISFLIFFFYLSARKGKKILLVFSILMFMFATIEKGRSMKAFYSNKKMIVGLEAGTNETTDFSENDFFEEHFDGSLIDNWVFQNFSFDENGCEMSPYQLKISNSKLVIEVKKNSSKGKPFLGGEIGSTKPFLYGAFTVRMINPIVPGTVSSFFLMNKWEPYKWEHKEIDIEFLGKDLCAVQFTVHHFMNGGRKHIYNEHTHNLGFDTSKEFYECTILWTPDSISWFVNGSWVHSVKDILIDDEMYIRMNHWTTDNTFKNRETRNWLGSIDYNSLPSKVYYDNVSYTSLDKWFKIYKK